MRITVLVIAIALLISLITIPEASSSQSQMILNPSPSTLRLFKGTKPFVPSTGQDITIIYSGNYTFPSRVMNCSFTVTVSQETFLGLRAVKRQAETCSVSGYDGRIVYVSVVIGFTEDSVFTGGSRQAYFISSATLFVNGSRANINIQINPVNLEEIRIVSIAISDVKNVAYTYLPRDPAFSNPITFLPRVTLEIYLEYSSSLDRGESLTLVATQSLTGDKTTVSFYPSKGSRYTIVNLNNVYIYYSMLRIEIFHGTNPDVLIEYADIDLSFILTGYGLGTALVTVTSPVFIFRESRYILVTTVYVHEVQNGNVKVKLTVDGDGREIVKEFHSPGYDELLFEFEVGKKVDRASGKVTIGFYPIRSYVSVELRYEVERLVLRGAVIYLMFLITGIVVFGSAVAMFLFGFFTRNMTLVSSSLLFMILLVLIYSTPILMATAIRIAVLAGADDPVGVQDVNIINLGDKVADSLTYVSTDGIRLSNTLFTAALGIIAVFIALVIAAGLTTILPGVSIALGSFAAQLIGPAIMLLLGSSVLAVMSTLFPYFSLIILVLMFFTIILQAFFASVTGNYQPVVGGIVSFAFFIFLILMAPMLIASVSRLETMGGDVPFTGLPIGRDIFLPMRPFYGLAIAIVRVILIVVVIAAGFQRLMSSLQAFGQIV